MLGKLALPEIRELIEAHDDDTLHEVAATAGTPPTSPTLSTRCPLASKCTSCG